MLRIVGTTTAGHPVISGCYRFMETHGMPFDYLFDELNSRGMVPSIAHLLDEAQAAGANVERISERVMLAYRDVYESP